MLCSLRRLVGVARYRLAVLLVVAVAPTAAHAVLIAEERFLTSAAPTGPEYTLGAIEGQNPTSFGFTGAWFSSTGTSPTVASASLNYADSNFPAETGGRMLSPTDNSRVHRLLAPATNPFQASSSGTVYMSFLLQTGTNNGYRAFEMHNGGNDDGAHRTLQIGLSSFTDFPSTSQFGFRVNNNGTFDASLGQEDLGIHLFLVKFALSMTNNADAITVWNNPNISSLASDPAGGVTLSGFNFLADRLGAGHFSGNQYGFDELRIGTTLQDVLTDFLVCDVNGNGVCNSSDAAIISDNMYISGTFANGDLDNSGTIDFDDVRLFKYHPARVVGFDAPGGDSIAIPEPAGLLLVGIATICVSVLASRLPRKVAVTGPVSWQLSLFIGVAFVAIGASPARAAEDLLNDALSFSGKQLELRPYAQLPAVFNDVISMTTRPGDTRLFVSTQEGMVFAVKDNGNGTGTAQEFFNVAAAIDQVTDRTLFGSSGHDGLQSVAFHPDFIQEGSGGFGKLYTTFMESRPTSAAEHHYLGDSSSGNVDRDSVLVEWEFDHATGQVDPSSYRELFRARLPIADHMIKQAKFNPYSEPGDDDYGLLYLTHGDTSSQQSTEDRTQSLNFVAGKMLRIDPLESGGNPYTIPASNPFAASGDPAALKEIYALGFRNPHNFSFNQDDNGNVHILVGDIGRNNVEEVNLVVNGGNYGWAEREGTFVHKQGSNFGVDAGYLVGVTNLPENEATVGVDARGDNYIYPVAQYDHNSPNVSVGDDYVSVAIASGFVIRNGSDPALHNQFIFNNFGGNHINFQSDVYHTDFQQMLDAVTQLDADDEGRDHPSKLTEALVQRIRLALDHDGNPLTPAQVYDEFNSMLGTNRNDARYGEGVSGEMYISNKINNTIYLVTNSVVDNRLTLTVDRSTSEMTITNATGSEVVVDSVSVFSPSGSLTPAEFQSLGGDWTLTAGNSAKVLNQSNAMGSLTLTGAASGPLGDAYDAQLIAFGEPAGEDVQFLFSTAGPNGRAFAGDVVYTGVSTVPNTIVLTVDVASGRALALNRTPFAQEVEGYTISSGDGSLNPAGWNSLEAQAVDDGDWLASPALATRFTEFQENGTTTFDNATPFELGEIFESGGVQDLDFEFQLAGEGALRTGLVVYILAGDYNGDNIVNAADYTVWRDRLASDEPLPNDMSPESVTIDDYLVWKNNFGAVMPGVGSGSAASAVPEPSLLALVGSALLAFVSRRRPPT